MFFLYWLLTGMISMLITVIIMFYIDYKKLSVDANLKTYQNLVVDYLTSEVAALFLVGAIGGVITPFIIIGAIIIYYINQFFKNYISKRVSDEKLSEKIARKLKECKIKKDKKLNPEKYL